MPYAPQDEPDSQSTGESKTRRNAILTEQNPIEIIEALPPSTFPVACRFSIARSQNGDETDSEYRQPSCPVDLQHSTGVYVPETTIHFDNPARRPPDREVGWRPQAFIEELTTLLDADVAEGLTAEDITLSRFTLVEVPQHLVTTDAQTGDHVVKPDLYTGEEQMTIARFRKHNSLSATHVRNELADALPGRSRTPARLTDLQVVTAKPARHGDYTTTSPGRTRYYTEAEAERTDTLERTPAHYQSRYINRQADRTRPLSPAVSDLNEFVPTLLRQTDDLVRVVKFVGHEQEHRSFVATEVRT